MGNIRQSIAAISWENYATLRGDADARHIEELLLDLFSDDHEKALQATYILWDELCHQGQVASAALPAYDILLQGVQTLVDSLKVELLDILYNMIGGIQSHASSCSWQGGLREKFERDASFFAKLREDSNEDIAAFAELIVDQL